MLAIRHQQWGVLRKDAEEQTYRRVSRAVRTLMPGDTMGLSDAQLLDLVRMTAVPAAHYGLVSEPALAWFVAASVQFSPSFHTSPALQAIFNGSTLGPDEKIDLISFLLRER